MKNSPNKVLGAKKIPEVMKRCIETKSDILEKKYIYIYIYFSVTYFPHYFYNIPYAEFLGLSMILPLYYLLLLWYTN